LAFGHEPELLRAMTICTSSVKDWRVELQESGEGGPGWCDKDHAGSTFTDSLRLQWSASGRGRRAYREDWKKWLVGLFCSQKSSHVAIYIKG